MSWILMCEKTVFIGLNEGVTDGTASGKTTVCDMIIAQLHDQRVVLVNQDAFYRSLSDEHRSLSDEQLKKVNAFDTELLLACMDKIKHGQVASIPNYDFKTHKSVEPGRMVNPAMSLSWKYDKFVKPSFDEFILASMKYADVIIPRGAYNEVAIELIVQHIRTKLGQNDLCKIYPNIFVIHSTFQVVEYGLGHLPFTEHQISTPTGSVYSGVIFCKRLCGVSVIRSGESMKNALRACCKGIKPGKIFIHRESKTGEMVFVEPTKALLS